MLPLHVTFKKWKMYSFFKLSSCVQIRNIFKTTTSLAKQFPQKSVFKFFVTILMPFTILITFELNNWFYGSKAVKILKRGFSCCVWRFWFQIAKEYKFNKIHLSLLVMNLISHNCNYSRTHHIRPMWDWVAVGTPKTFDDQSSK